MFFKKDLFLNLNLIGDLVKYEVFVIQIFKKTKLKKKKTNKHTRTKKKRTCYYFRHYDSRLEIISIFTRV